MDSSLRNIRFEDLFKLSEIQEIQDQFANATGVASIITTPDGTSITSPSNFTHLCKDIIRKTPQGKKNCYNSDCLLGTPNSIGPRVQICKSGGLWDAGAAIMVEGTHLANWLIGQVRNEEQSHEKILQYAQKIGADPDEVLKAFLKVPSMRQERFEAVAQLIFTLANTLSKQAYQNYLLHIRTMENQEVQQKLQKSQLRFQSLVETTSDWIWEMDSQAKFRYASPRVKTLLGYDPEELLGKSGYDLMPPDEAESISKIFDRYVAEKLPFRNLRNVNLHKDGQRVVLESNGDPFFDDHGNLLGYRGSDRDITQREEMEQRMVHTQKMRSIGQLAGGVAHDFNNILTAVIGYAELLPPFLKGNEEARLYVDMIIESAQRASHLSSQLLAFGRKQRHGREPVDLHREINHTLSILRETLDRGINLQLNLQAERATIMGDRGHLQSMLMCLAINAAQSMANGGDLLFSSQNIALSPQSEKGTFLELPSGEYLQIDVKDQGIGMSQETMNHIFEPYYSTKNTGRGSGMGLAALFGNMKQHGGAVEVHSKENVGSVFTLYFPL